MISIFAEGGLWLVLAFNAFLLVAAIVVAFGIIAIALKGYRSRKGKNDSKKELPKLR